MLCVIFYGMYSIGVALL